MGRIIRLLMLVVIVVVAGCSDDEPGSTMIQPPPGPGEVVSAPDTPVGEADPLLDETFIYRTGGAVSSEGHPIEYRFDFDGDGAHDYSEWSAADSVVHTWASPGVFRVRAHARCAIHPNVVSGGSPTRTVTVRMVPMTRITRVTNTYQIGATLFTDTLDVKDAVPDTVPYQSLLTVYYEGSDVLFDPSRCGDLLNQCFEYQIRFDAVNPRDPNFLSFTSWLPFDPEDSNPFGVLDSSSLNIGTADYTIFARATNADGIPDPNPPSVFVVGSFAPVLDEYVIEEIDGTVVSDGDTITWDWWAPADSQAVVVGGELRKRKTFRFLVRARGHDHPKERTGSGVLAWYYAFTRDDGSQVPLGRAGVWVGGLSETELLESVAVTLEYPAADIVGDAIFVDNPPVWQNRTFEFALTGQDRKTPFDLFEQWVVYLGRAQLVNAYDASDLGRLTDTRKQQFHLRLVR